MKIAALILAGGQGSRLGGVDKAFVRLGGVPLVEIALQRLRPQAGVMAISANGDPGRFAAYGVPVLPDATEFSGKGPLAGVATGLRWAAAAKADFLLTIPVDTPFFPQTLAADLSPGPSVACFQGRQHHLVSLWPVDFCPGLEAFLRAPDKYKVRDALDLCGARQVAFGGESDPFVNLNTPEDIEQAENPK